MSEAVDESIEAVVPSDQPNSSTLPSSEPAVSESNSEVPENKDNSAPLVQPLLAVGFCGVDESIEPEKLVEVSNAMPWVEWGVLFRPEKEGQARFPGMNWVNKLSAIAKESGTKLAAHLCSTRCNEALKGDFTFIKNLKELGFKRVQINATQANGVDTSDLPNQSKSLLETIRAVPEIEFILQRNTETQPLWGPILALPVEERPANISVLFDDSVGTGVERQTFPCPSTTQGVPCGYAGGLGPKNILSILTRMRDSVADSFSTIRAPWVDMESSLREINVETNNDTFSLEKVNSCIETVVQAEKNGVIRIAA